MDFNDIQSVNQELKDAQGYEADTRAATREATLFVTKRDGQWETSIVNKMPNRPRYTYDKVSALIRQIYGEIENADFTIRVRPAGGGSDKDNANIYDGLIRNIRNASGAESIFNSSTLEMLQGGFAAWEIKQDWADADSFDQDLFIRKIHNAIDRVWFDPSAEEQDNSDAMWCVVLSNMSKAEFQKEFPDKQDCSLSAERESDAYSYKNTDVVIVGKLLYKKPRDIEIVRMSNGAVYRIDDKYESIRDELALAGIVEEDRRIRKSWRVYSRLFSEKEFLTEEEETVFDYLPVIAMYGNYQIVESKRIWSGIVEKLMDSQRTYNYANSRLIEDTALAPKEKLLMTREQAAGHTEQLKSMNVNNEPVLFYNHIPDQPQPYKIGGAQVNQGLMSVAQTSSQDINAIAGLFNANIGSNIGLQSGVALDIQTEKGNNGMQCWITAREIAMCYTGKVLVNAIPRVYDSTRQVRILNEDGAFDMQTINQVVLDQQTGQKVEINNLASGQYDVICEAGLAFKSRQREEKAAFVELAQVIPQLAEIASDILLKNTEFDGMSQAAERMRLELLNQDKIPQTQMSDEELAQLEARRSQPPQPDPAMVMAQAESMKAEADMLAQQNKQTELQIQAAKLQADIQAKQEATQSRLMVDAEKISQGNIKLDQEQQKIDLNAQMQDFNKFMQVQQLQMQQLTDAVNQLATIKDAIGADTIVGQGNIETYADQVNVVHNAQDRIDPDATMDN